MNLRKMNDLELHNRSIAGELSDAFSRVLGSGWFALGPEVEAFESEFADYCGAQHCVGVASGTDALELVLRGLGVERDDEVITAANAGMYCSSAILAIGGSPVYADVDEASLTLSPECVAERITPRTRAVVVTHLFGQMADMPALRALADARGVALVEDCAQSHGARLAGRRAGCWGDAAAFSFFPTKNLGALGDGGAVVTGDPKLAERVRRLRQYGWERKYLALERGGRNSRLDEIQAAALRVKLHHLDRWNERRIEVAALYASELAHEKVRIVGVPREGYVAHLFVIRTPQRTSLRAFLKSNEIACDIHYPVLDYQQPALESLSDGVCLPTSERALGEILTLPCYPELELADVRQGCRLINSWKG